MSARITISLPEEVARLVGREAKRRGETVSAFVREALEAYLASSEEQKKDLPFVGIGRSGKKHTARNAEAILEREWAGARRR
jgi:metal-responsive CopG/Arc/MetJ family transcriptional regulator